MERNVQSFGMAINSGYNPLDYIFDPEKILVGEYDAVLDFKIWSKRIIGINCYFTKLLTKEKIQLTVYGNKNTGMYVVPGTAIDFTSCAVGIVYHISVTKNSKGKISLTKVDATL